VAGGCWGNLVARRADIGWRGREVIRWGRLTPIGSRYIGSRYHACARPAEAVEVLNLLLKFFGDGERWIKGRFSDRRGNCCLVGAIDFVSSHHAIKGNAAERYLAAAISDERGQRICSNENGQDYARLRAALRRAMRGECYRASETLLRRDSLSDFNDGCKDFAELRALIVQARATAMNDGDPGPARRPNFDIVRDELVMA
jgi:hypothetical protein